MKTLLSLFVLFFSSSVFAEAYKCTNGEKYYLTSVDEVLSVHPKDDLELVIDKKNKTIKYDDKEFKFYNDDKDVISALYKYESETIKLKLVIEIIFNRITKKLIWSQVTDHHIFEGDHFIKIYHDCKLTN